MIIFIVMTLLMLSTGNLVEKSTWTCCSALLDGKASPDGRYSNCKALRSPEMSPLPSHSSDSSSPPSISNVTQEDDLTSLHSRGVSPPPVDSQDESLPPLLPYEGPPPLVSLSPSSVGNGNEIELYCIS